MKYVDLMTTATDCLLYGILLAAVTMLILYFVLQMISKSCVKTIPFYLAGIVLAPLLVVQDSLIVAAFQAKGMVDAVEVDIQQMIGAYEQSAMDLNETQAVLDQVVKDFPLVGWFTNITNMQVSNAQDLASQMADGIRDYLNTYLWKRFGWCTAFISLAVLITFLSDKSNKHTLQQAERSRRDSGRTTSVTRTDRHTVRSSRRHRF